MGFVSILNDVLGPVMRGPSSSHTAGAYRIATVARSLFGGQPVRATFAFDPDGSYAPTYAICGVDLAFTCGLLGVPLTDPSFFEAESLARAAGLAVSFEVRALAASDHPNYVEILLTGSDGGELHAAAASVGGGLIEYRTVDGLPAPLEAKSWEVLVRCVAGALPGLVGILGEPALVSGSGESCLALFRRATALPAASRQTLTAAAGVENLYEVAPVFSLQRGAPLFDSAATMLECAEAAAQSLGEVALAYESKLLGMSPEGVSREIGSRLAVMRRSVEDGLAGRELRLRFLEPCAGEMLRREQAGQLTVGGPHARAAARALAATHVNNSMGVVCAAPTGGSAGTIPGTLVTLLEDLGIGEDAAVRALLAAGAVGLILALRGTFAAETAGCQVEIGAAGAMAAAAVVEAFGGTAREACDAAAIAFHNAMGLVCDTVQGACEIPCHTRNALAASGAFVCADLVLGGYANPIGLDDTVDAVMSVGAMMAPELRCTSRGGLAVVPSALALRPREPE
jgi:L-serine dehydratase